VKMANLAQMVNVIAPIMTNEEGLFLQPTYFPLVEFGKQRGNMSLDVWASSPTYTVANRPPLGYLDVSATYDAESSQIYLNVLNRSQDRDIATRIENLEGRLGGEISVWEMNHPDLKATHTFGDDERVRPRTWMEAVDVENGAAFSYTFPAHSLTILRIPVRAEG
ncbi:MAG: alpha-N-arabinofuranosidase, partial [Gemmatimonadetes bacterium]|nr:alpha-N-arabinofuranosidase [Gemmatimonadota bacterium]